MEKATQLQDILKELVQSHDDDKLSALSDKALQLLEACAVLDYSQKEQKSLAFQLHTSGVALWNKSVALKSATALSSSLNAQLRHIACNVVFMCTPLEQSESIYQKQLAMATKTGRAWLDCSNHTMADTALQLALECWEKFIANFPALCKEPSNLKSLFRILCSRAEVSIGLGQQDTAIRFIQQAKELLHVLEKETAYLSLLCYNLGLDEFQKENFQNSVVWLKESYDIGRGCVAVGATKQARTLRLLANAYLQWDGSTYWQKALNAISLANSEHNHPAGLVLKTNILLQYENEDERLNSAFKETLQHPDLSVEPALNIVRLAAQHNRQQLASVGIQLLEKRFQNTPDVHEIHLLYLDMLLSSGQNSEAKQLIEDSIIAHNTGDPMDIKTKKRFHVVMWEQAAKAFEASDFKEAVCWYNYSLSIFPLQEGGSGVAKLQRNRAACYIQLQDNEQAAEAIQQAKKHDPESPFCHFLDFKLAMLLGKEEQAIQAVVAMAKCNAEKDEMAGLVSLVAQMAFEKSNRNIAVVALEKLIEHTCNPQQTFTALRCLIRLKLTVLGNESSSGNEKIAILQSLLSYIKLAREKFKSIQSNSALEAEALWFMKIAWNLALQCGENYNEMAQFFNACGELSNLMASETNVLSRQKTCHLMAAAANINLARSSKQQDEKTLSLEAVLKHVSGFNAICQRLHSGMDTTDPTLPLLMLYEFEAKLYLGLPDLDSVVTKAAALSHVDPKTYEGFAALAIQGPPTANGVGIRSLKKAIQQHLQVKQVDYIRLSKCYHSLVVLTMGTESSSDMASKEQGWNVLTEVLEILDTRPKNSFPEMEVLWFLTKAWNCGIHFYSSLRFKEAEQWCSLGMRFLKHLPQMRLNYEEQITGVYSEVLSRLQSIK